jgi:hypothetical protein
MSIRMAVKVAAILCTVTAPASMAQETADDPHDALVPIRPKPPYRLWYQPPLGQTHPELYSQISFVNSISSLEEARFWNERGVAVGRWAYGPQSPHTAGNVEYFLNEYNPQLLPDWPIAAVGIDEWISAGPENVEACAKALRQTKTQWPEFFISCYVTHPDETFKALVADGTIDLAVIEAYTHLPGYGGTHFVGDRRVSPSGYFGRCKAMQEAGLLNKTIVMFGHMMEGLTAGDLNRLMAIFHDSFPQMPGVGFYGLPHGDLEENKALILYAERLSGLYYGDDVLFIDGFESGRFDEGGWLAEGRATVRNAFGWSFPYDNVAHPFNQRSNMTVGEPARVELSAPGEVRSDVTDMVRTGLAKAEAQVGLFLRLGTPLDGPPSPTACSARFHGLTSPDEKMRPALLLELGPAGQRRTLTRRPAVLGTLTARGQRPFNEPGLEWKNSPSGYQHALKEGPGTMSHPHAHGSDWHYPPGAADPPVSGTVMPALYYHPWWDEGAIYVRFDLSDVSPDPAETIGKATLVLHAAAVDNPAGVPLAVSRVTDEPKRAGCDLTKAAQLRSGASVTRQISTAGRKDVRLHYQFRTAGMRDAALFIVEWSDGAGWHSLRNVSTDAGFYPVAEALPEGAADKEGFAVRFRLTGSEQAEAYVDLVRLTGTPTGL